LKQIQIITNDKRLDVARRVRAWIETRRNSFIES